VLPSKHFSGDWTARVCPFPVQNATFTSLRSTLANCPDGFRERERCKVHQDWTTWLLEERVTSGHTPAVKEKKGAVFFKALTVIWDENVRGSAQTNLSCGANKLLFPWNWLPYRRNPEPCL